MNDAVAELDTERLTWMYRQMLRIREFEERVKATFTEHPGVIRGHTHLADGAEASIVSKIYRLSAHGNIIAPPGVPLHFPEHEAVAVFGAPEEYEAARRADPLLRMRDRVIAAGALDAGAADVMAASVREEMRAAVDFALASPYPAPDEALRHVYALPRGGHHGQAACLHRGDQRGHPSGDGSRRERSLFRSEPGHHRE